ncbi:MAG: hypothetical protein R2941_00115 [Desulfobacterales bacterium]
MTEKLFTRDTWKPKSFDEETSSVRVVAVTENPVRVWDWNSRQYIDEVLLVDGFSLPPSGKIPLLDAHNRSSVASVLGSARRFHPSGNTLECDVFFSGTDVGRNAAQNVREGHLTDFSVGYFPVESYYIREGESKDINGRFFRGPIKVTARWNLRELSLTPIGADQYATARSENGLISSPEGMIPSPPQMPNAPAQEPGSPVAQTPEQPMPPVQQNAARAEVQTPEPVQQTSADLQMEPSRPAVQTPPPQAVSPPAEVPQPDTAQRAVPQQDKKTPQTGQQSAEHVSERQRQQLPPKPIPLAPKSRQAERDFVDMIFYAFLAIAVLFILKGMFL